MSALTQFRERSNLDRAWRWIRSNPDPLYKRYCGELYSHFAVADDLLLSDLHDRLRREIYEPRHACKLMMPKKSGILRPYTILTVEDQIVYQALVNVIAERLAPKVRSRYLVQTFGHMYAGRSSVWFYKRWTDGYKAFNQAARGAVAHGLTYSASFDLTACYDSLDHGVLCHFLDRLGCEPEFCGFLRNCLQRWTATQERIYQGHGIPQGPLGSGLLAETVLQHFDQHTHSNSRFVYMRYVDDIRLFAKAEADLRRILVNLDRLSKDIGLFPQASKIDIHIVSNIDQELKSISNPTEAAVRGRMVNQNRLTKRIIQLTPRLSPAVRILDETRFKYLLAYANPSARLNSRLLTISSKRPDLTVNIARYFRRYSKLPKSVVTAILGKIRIENVYSYPLAEWIDVLDGRVRDPEMQILLRVLKRQWKPSSLPADLKAAAGKLLIREGQLGASQTQYAIHSVREWWVRSQLLAVLNDDYYGNAVLTRFLNGGLRDPNPDVSLTAAHRVAFLNTRVLPPYRDIQPSGGKALRQFGILQRPRGRTCGIEWSFSRLIGRATGLDWRRIIRQQISPGRKNGCAHPGPSRHKRNSVCERCRRVQRSLIGTAIRSRQIFRKLQVGQFGVGAYKPETKDQLSSDARSLLQNSRATTKKPPVACDRQIDRSSHIENSLLLCRMRKTAVRAHDSRAEVGMVTGPRCFEIQPGGF